MLITRSMEAFKSFTSTSTFGMYLRPDRARTGKVKNSELGRAKQSALSSDKCCTRRRKAATGQDQRAFVGQVSTRTMADVPLLKCQQ